MRFCNSVCRATGFAAGWSIVAGLDGGLSGLSKSLVGFNGGLSGLYKGLVEVILGGGLV